jgi:hypothetical protein
MATTDTKRTPARNGDLSKAPVKLEPSQEQLAEAADHERQIGFEAGAIWRQVAPDDENAALEATLTIGLFRKLRPLLRRPIPEGYISKVTAGKGKPYPSKGIKSLQVQIDRLDNVLGEGNWDWETRYLNDQGTLAEVEVWVIGGEDGGKLVSRTARGGVDRGSTIGNTFKGTETNAAKLAFARLGVGHEVYIGLTDLDPDVSEEAAEAQAEGAGGAVADPARPLPAEKVEPLRKAVEDAGLGEHLPMKLRSFGVDDISKLTVEQALSLYEWAKGEATGG